MKKIQYDSSNPEHNKALTKAALWAFLMIVVLMVLLTLGFYSFYHYQKEHAALQRAAKTLTGKSSDTLYGMRWEKGGSGDTFLRGKSFGGGAIVYLDMGNYLLRYDYEKIYVQLKPHGRVKVITEDSTLKEIAVIFQQKQSQVELINGLKTTAYPDPQDYGYNIFTPSYRANATADTVFMTVEASKHRDAFIKVDSADCMQFDGKVIRVGGCKVNAPVGEQHFYGKRKAAPKKFMYVFKNNYWQKMYFSTRNPPDVPYGLVYTATQHYVHYDTCTGGDNWPRPCNRPWDHPYWQQAPPPADTLLPYNYTIIPKKTNDEILPGH